MTIFARTEEPRGAPALSAFDRLPYFKKGTEVKQVSSYRRDNGNPDNSAFNYYRNPSAGGYVVLEEYAPGTLYRIWATELHGGNIRIYFDGEPSPRINKSVTSFFSGTSSPFLAPLVGNDQVSSGGFYSYYPITVICVFPWVRFAGIVKSLSRQLLLRSVPGVDQRPASTPST
jgi:hypothetical protein